MNKIPLLEKFAAQSLVYVDTGLSDGNELIFSKEKFAELIVEEMLDITDAHTEVFQTDRDKALIEHIKQSVKQHFGVEE